MNPPSTSKLCPVTKDALPEHNPQNGVRHLFDPTDTPDGMQGDKLFLVEPMASVNRSTISVSITAGLTALMRTPCAE